MARISVKYCCGSKVRCNGVSGIITAIFIRGKGRAYEFSYVLNGEPKSCTAEECELVKDNYKMGFGRLDR